MISRRRTCGLLALLGVFWAVNCPAPIIYRPGEGWTYEAVGSEGKWERNRAKDQLDVAKDSFEKKDFSTALKAARRVVKVWPLSDYSGEAQYLIGRCYEAKGNDQRAFKEYQAAVQKYPRSTNYNEVVHRQTEIADRFLDGQRFKVFGVIPAGRSMDKTAKMFATIATNAPFSEDGMKAQMKLGEAREKQKEYVQAAKSYEKAADKYHDRPEVASTALFKAGQAYNKMAAKAEYDQSVAGEAVNALSDFKSLHPKDERIPEADSTIRALKVEQARGAYETAKFYEKYKRYQSALIYFNEVLVKDPDSPYAREARQRIEALKPKADVQAKANDERDARDRERERAYYQRKKGTGPIDRLGGGTPDGKPSVTTPPSENPRSEKAPKSKKKSKE